MDEKRYKEIEQMDKESDEYKALTPQEIEDYLQTWYIKQTSQDTALADLLTHVNIAKQGGIKVWSTGFPKLDEKLDGGFLGGNLIILGAIASLGKTTFALQIADQIAAQGNDVIIFSLEMSKKELNAKSISRNTFMLTDELVYDKKQDDKYHRAKAGAENRLTMSDILRGRVGEIMTNQSSISAIDDRGKLFLNAYSETAKLNDHIFIIRDNDINLDKIRDIIELHESIYSGFQKPFIIIDYLQILKAQDNSEFHDKRLLTDEDVNGLKDLAVKTDVPILLISSFNRNSYLDPVSMSSFKESGGIEYSSDTLIALQYSGMQYQKHYYKTKKMKKAKLVYESKIDHDTRVRQLLEDMDVNGAEGRFLPIDVVLLKNRGVSKGKILFEFCPKYNVFYERYNQDDKKYCINREADDIEDDDSTASSVVSGDSGVASSTSSVTIGKTVK